MFLAEPIITCQTVEYKLSINAVKMEFGHNLYPQDHRSVAGDITNSATVTAISTTQVQQDSYQTKYIIGSMSYPALIKKKTIKE